MNPGFTWTVMSTHKTCNGGIQKNLNSSQGTNTLKNFFPKKLTVPIFSGILMAVRCREIIQQFLEQLHDDEIVNGYFQQDGAPAHTTYETMNMILVCPTGS
jgi:hypothetical protein